MLRASDQYPELQELTIKPALSLEIGSSPSQDANELAAALSHEEGEVAPSLEAACQLVHTLLDQLAWNDAPPTNDDLLASRVIKEPKSPRKSSRQCHVPLKSPREASLYNTSTDSDDPSDLWKAHYNLRCNPAEQKMGNVALATLCARTLETVGKPSRPTKEVNSGKRKTSPRTESESPRLSAWRRTNKQSPKSQWLRRKHKKASLSVKSPTHGEIIVSPSRVTKFRGETPAFVQLDEERDDHFTKADQENVEPTRLQMFGSEYARYLSTTALAPKDLTSNRGPTMPRANLNSRRRNAQSVQNLEDAEQSVLTGPITDLIVTIGEDPPPKGYYRISQSAGGAPFFLRDRKTSAYINVKKETNWDRAAQRPCVTALALIFPERREFVPPGFSVVRRHSSLPKNNDRNPANLNLGGEQVFLCFRRSREGNPITGILPLLPSKQESIPEGYTVIERTPRNHVASIQTSSCQIFLAYRQRLAILEALRPLPLVMSVRNSSLSTKKLTAYYCTGGTIVESRVGRFHIMDRSTHTLLSPSSISNRLSLIEASRRKTFNSIADLPTYSYSAGNADRPRSSTENLTSSILLAHGLGTPANRSVVSDLERLSSLGDFESTTSSDLHRPLVSPVISPDHEINKPANQSFSTVSSTTDEESFEVPAPPSSRVVQSLYASEDKEVQRCLEALNFIPVVSTAVDENDPRGMLRFQARVAILTPVLTACYTRHGGSALLAVEGLTDLLRGDFFASDVNMEQDSSSRITLLDIVVQVVSDVATMGTQETHMQACVEFVESAVKYGCGHLNMRTVGYVMRFYLFVFFFGVSTPMGSSGVWGMVKGRDHFLLEDPRINKEVKYLPGGAPQSAILSLKDLIAFSVGRLRSLTSTDRMALERRIRIDQGKLVPEIFNDLIDGLVKQVVDTSIHRVDIANYTQLAMHQIHRSGGSELFWYDMMNSCGSGLFGHDVALREETRNMYAMCFALLANCVKVASSKVRKDKHSEGVPRDVASKLMSLEMLQFFLEKWIEGKDQMEVPDSQSFATFAFCIRRLVVPCLLSNTRDAMDDPRVYRRIIRIIGTLWSSPTYRHHMKLELGILMEHFVLKILRLGPQILYKEKPKDEEDMTYLFAQQIELMREIKNWFCDSRGLLELFLNFDTDMGTQQVGGTKELLSGIQWKITQQICASLCSMSEKCGEFIAKQIRESQSMSAASSPDKRETDVPEVLEGVSGITLARESAQRLRKSALEAISQLVQSLAESAAAMKGQTFRTRVDAWAPRSDGDSLPVGISSEDSQDESDRSASSSGCDGVEKLGKRGKNPEILGYWQKAIQAEKEAEEEADEDKKEDAGGDLDIAFDIAREKGLKKAINYLIACNILTPSPRDIASFLRIHRTELRPADLGKYLGDGGSDGSETEYWNLIRFSYIRAISFVGMTVEQGLRHLLTNGGFRLPGEAQQVDRLITTFAQCYWEDNAGDQVHCPFQDQDTVFLLSFAIIMLNTDLHKSNPATATKKHQRKRMTKPEFLTNLRGVANSDELNQEYLSTIYDSIEALPIVLHDQDMTESSSVCSENIATRLSHMVDNAKSVDALLRGLSVHDYRFVSLEDCSQDFGGDLKDATANLARKFLVQIWHQFHGLINAALEIAHFDLKGMESSVIVLKYALCLTICLDMPMERVAFLGQLGRFRLFNAWRRGETNDISQDSYKEEDWYKGIEEACKSDNEKGKLMSLKLIDELVNDLGLNIAVDVEGRKEMRDSVRRLQNAEFLMNDPTRTFLRQGNLLKRANRSGRCVEYQFFLFSDMLIYAKKIPGSGGNHQYKIHEELPLILMKVVDWFPPELKKEAKRAIQIYHPRKKFLAFCASTEERRSWVTELRSAIDKELSRKVAIEAARMAAAKSH
jgi:hypothetical protein